MGESSGGIEIWRGGVEAWECDEIGHLNVRFYVQRAVEGLAAIAAELGMPHAFSIRANATLLVKEHHIRFLKEARQGARLHMTGGVVDMDETGATLLQVLAHSDTEEPCASFLTRVEHAASRDGRIFPWPSRALERAGALQVAIPPGLGPRGVATGPVTPTATLARAEALGLARVARGALGAQDCDVFGRMRTEMVMGRIADGNNHLTEPLRGPLTAALPGLRVGGVALEYRILYLAHPRAGDQLDLRGGLKAADAKIGRTVYWMLDPVSGSPWAVAEAVSAFLDLDARKVIAVPPGVEAGARAKTIEGLTL